MITGHCVMVIMSFNPHHPPMTEVLSLFPFYRWGNRGPLKWLINWCMVSQLVKKAELQFEHSSFGLSSNHHCPIGDKCSSKKSDTLNITEGSQKGVGCSEEGNSRQRDIWAKLKLYRWYSGNGKEFWHGWCVQGVTGREKAWEKFELANICKPFILVIKVRWVLEGIFFQNMENFYNLKAEINEISLGEIKSREISSMVK